MRLVLVCLVLSGCSVRLVDERISPAALDKAFHDRDEALKEIAKLLELHEAKIKALEAH